MTWILVAAGWRIGCEWTYTYTRYTYTAHTYTRHTYTAHTERERERERENGIAAYILLTHT